MTTPRPTKAQRRDEARLAAQQLREEQARKAKRQRTIAISALVVGLLAVGGIVALILGQADDLRTEASDQPIADVRAPQGSTAAGGIPVGPEGIAGQPGPDDTVRVTVYSDFMCPFCGLFETTNGPVLDELREAGDITVEYHPVSILDRYAEGSEFSTRASTAVALVADAAPEAFVELNALLFANQPSEGTTGLSDADIAALARQAGVPDDVAAQIEDGSYLTGEDSFRPWVEAATVQASKDLERLATPTILIDGEILDTAEYDWRNPGELERAIADAS